MYKSDEISIRNFQTEDIRTLKSIAKMNFDEESIGAIEQSRAIFAKTAHHHEGIVGTIFAWRNSFHDACTYFRIFVHPSFTFHVEEKLLQALFSFVSREHLDHLPLQTSLWETSCFLRKVYVQQGGKEVRRTYEPILRVNHVPSVPQQADSSIMTVQEIATQAHFREQLIQLTSKNYERTHLDNPVSKHVGQDVWEKLVFANDLITEGSYVYVDQDKEELVAYSLLHQSEDKDTLELGWCGSRYAASVERVSQLIHYQVGYAKKTGVKKLLGECDTTDEAAMHVLASFPFDPCSTWITYSIPARGSIEIR